MPQGFWMFVWLIEKVGGVDGLIAKCHQYGIDGIFLKGADGGSHWDHNPNGVEQFTPSVLGALRSAGIRVIGWQYVYGGPGNGAAAWSTIQGEGDASVWIMDQGADGYCSDPEAEIVGKSAAVLQECATFRAKYPHSSFGFNPYPYPSSQVMQPWIEWNASTDYCMPQVYQRQDWNVTPTEALAKVEADFAHWWPIWDAAGHRHPPLILDWQAASWGANPTPVSDITEAATISRGKYPAIAWWDADALDAAEWTAIGAARIAFEG